jgi:hypothetical protein
MFLIRAMATGACAIAFGGAAYAADDIYYPESLPPSGHPLYGASSLAGDLTLVGGLWTGDSSGHYVDAGGRVAIGLGSGWVFQPEVWVGTDSDTFSYIEGVAHFYRRTPTSAVGGFVGASSYTGGSDWSVGIEAESYAHPNTIVGGRLWYGDGTFGSWVEADGWWSYFFNPDLMLTAEGEAWLGSGGVDSGAEGSLTLTKRFPGTQLAGFLSGWIYHDVGPWTVAGAEVGLRWYFDPPGTTLYDAETKLVAF